jgi:putative oxidoreductase
MLMPPHDPIASTPALATVEDFGRLLLRLGVGALILLHGLAKIVNGPGAVQGLLQNHGLPAALSWGVYVGEVLAPLLLIAGLWTRAAALLVVANMLVALGLAHRDELFSLGDSGGWAIELQAMYLLGAAAIALLGAGRLSLGGESGRFN